MNKKPTKPVKVVRCVCGRVGRDVQVRKFQSTRLLVTVPLCDACWNEELMDLLD